MRSEPRSRLSAWQPGGMENFTDILPMELDAIEALVREKGVVQKVPSVTVPSAGR